jgi:TolB-like protein/Tfp pilus assembly protein PilF
MRTRPAAMHLMPESDRSANAQTDESPAAQATPSSVATSDVFVSYATQDAAIARAVVAALERHALKCWIAPRDVTPGALYADEIIRAINGTRVLVLILSESAIASPHIGKEVERASSKRRPIVTLRTDAARLTTALEYFLSESQWIELGTEGTESAFAKLLTAVRRRLASASAILPGAPSDRSSSDRAWAKLRPSWPLLATLVAIGAPLAWFAVDRSRFSKHLESSDLIATQPPVARAPASEPAAPAAFTPPPHSIAVLPFVNMSGDASQEYFSDGISEELLNALSRLNDLQVTARTSSFSFKGQNVDVSFIGRRLNVATILEGSVRRAGNTVRITAQLINTVTGFHIWSQTYDRNLKDILKVQEDVATSVAHQLEIRLVGDEATKAVLGGTNNAQAHILYLQGHAISHIASTRAEYDRAIDYYRQALKADPAYVDAWASLMIALSNEVIRRFVSSGAVSAEMRHAADEVIALAPDTAAAHSARAQIYWTLDWNWQAATTEYKRTYDLTPNDYNAVRRLADVTFFVVGDDATALDLYQRAIDLDPVAEANYEQISYYYLYKGRLSEAESAIRKALDFKPMGAGLGADLGRILIARAKANDALTAIQREPDERARRWGLALVYNALGRKADANAALAEFERRDADTRAYDIAQIHADRGEIDQAFGWLERAYDQRNFTLAALKRDPLLSNLTPDPRYAAFLRKMNLPE